MSVQSQSARAIFERALELTTNADRQAYLDECCAGRADLRDKVEALLRAHADAGSFLAEPALDAQQTQHFDPIAERAGTMIGQYKLLEPIGEGGFGVVYMAEQQHPVRRKVALKVIKPGIDTRQVIARFEAERQALALMEHENIAKVLDAGATDSGRPYFVMELVRGVPITEFCDENELPPRERLELFVQVCRAVQHAHNKGIIHRDIKPTNVLVTLNDGVPVPKVIDFGVAKATGQQLTEKTLFTQFAQMVGTPLYMSPEQAEMTSIDVDTRSDVYSLGVLLYELLTGTTPLDKERLKSSPFDEMRRIIREEEPPKPSTRLSTIGKPARIASARGKSDHRHLGQFIRGDLDWIVMKALEKERSRRYETASGLARDIERYLRDEPVEASPPSARYRLQKFVRRNKGPVVATSLIVLSLVAGLIGTTWGLIRAEKQRLVVERQRNELAERNRELQAAHEHERLLNERARQAIESVTSETAIDLLARENKLRPEQMEFLDKMIQYYTESIDGGAATEQEQLRRAQAYYRIGRLNRILGRPGSEKAYRQAVALCQQMATDFPHRPEFRQVSALSQNELGRLLRDSGRSSEAESAYVEAAAILKQLAADFGNRGEYRQALAGVLNNLGILLQANGQLTEAENAQREALAIRKQLAADFPDEPTVRRALAMSHSNVGWLLQSTGKRKEAVAAFVEAVALQRQVVGNLPNQPENRLGLGKYLLNLGNALAETGRPKEAEAASAEGLAILKQLVVDFPNRPEFHQELAERVGKKPQPATEEQERPGGTGGAKGEGEEEVTGDLGDSDVSTNSDPPNK
jgi:serine/threonine protein kinase/tetratricopeptide (TPR) repeat protein